VRPLLHLVERLRPLSGRSPQPEDTPVFDFEQLRLVTGTPTQRPRLYLVPPRESLLVDQRGEPLTRRDK
jgi:hypothetical protein